ncbi:hypothetical protein [Haloarchaeobius litoreus]|uniref:Uncharacterized protein n=1 Tax=Haloarchaeobius litoreus TaxID=755306 RepID=A0ABD6DML7_9EURY|nr:hypothetical protein [Haloarchaeobius litoreus]
MHVRIPLPFDAAEPIEYLTFGRKSWLLFRVWLLQVVILFFEVQILRSVHPSIERALGSLEVVQLYLVISLVALLVLASFARRMGRLTFAASFRHPLHVGLSVFGYLGMAGSLVLPVVSLTGVPPAVADGVDAVDVALVSLVTTTLAALLIVEFYALFDLEDYPSKREIRTTTRGWVRALDWCEEPDGTRRKRERYEEFRQRTDDLSALLEYAATAEGRELGGDFEDWVADYQQQSLLSQEAIVRGDTRNQRLQDQHRSLQDLVDRFERISEM